MQQPPHAAPLDRILSFVTGVGVLQRPAELWAASPRDPQLGRQSCGGQRELEPHSPGGLQGKDRGFPAVTSTVFLCSWCNLRLQPSMAPRHFPEPCSVGVRGFCILKRLWFTFHLGTPSPRAAALVLKDLGEHKDQRPGLICRLPIAVHWEVSALMDVSSTDKERISGSVTWVQPSRKP